MKAELGVKLAKAFVKAMENTNDMALIFFEEGGLRTKLMDSNGYRLVDIRIRAEDMISYDFESLEENDKTVEFGIIVSHLKDMTKAMTVKEKDTLLIEYDLQDPTWLSLTSCGVNRKLRLLKSSMMKRHKTPTIDSLWSAKLPYKPIKSFLTSIGKTEVFSIIVNQEQPHLTLKATTDEGHMETEINDIDFHLETSEGSQIEILLGTENFANTVSTSGASTKLSFLGGNASTPLEIEWDFEKLRLHSWIATRQVK